MSKADKEKLIDKIKAAVAAKEQTLASKAKDNDSSALSERQRLYGVIDGLMEAINLVRAS